jgi:chromosomal replication initiator protein
MTPLSQYDYCKKLKKERKNDNTAHETGEAIVKKTCEIFHVGEDEIKTKSRKRERVDARKAAIWIMRKYTKMTCDKIGEFFGSRDHTTIIHAKERAQDLMDTDEQFKEKVYLIIQEVLLK